MRGDLNRPVTTMTKSSPDEDDDVTKKKGKKKDKKKAKKKTMSLSSVVGARITEEQLSAQEPSNIPEDWKTPGKYHPVCVAIWKASLNFVQVFLDKQTNDGSVLHLVPLLLPWDAPHDSPVISLLMHYMPTQLTNLVKGDLHPESAERSDGSLRSDCWELVCQSVGEELYKILCFKMNFSPHAHPHNGKRTDIFSTEDSLMTMESYQVFLLFVFETVARTHLCSQAVQNQVTALYGGRQHSENTSRLSECVFLYSSFVLFCVRFRMAVGDQLANRVFREGFPYFKYCRTKSESSLS